jgi:hypothetical protein
MRSSRFPFLVPFVLSALSAVQPLCFADLSEALKADDSRLIVVRDVLSVDQDTTIPKGRHLRIEPGGLIKIATGVTLTIHGGLEAGAYQVFAGDGRVSGDTKIERVLPEWFFDGNYNDEESDWSGAINKSIDFAANNCRTVFLGPRVYNVNSTVDLTSTPEHQRAGMKLMGALRSSQYERGTALLGNTGPGNPILETTDTDGIHVENLALRAGKKTPSTIGLLQARGTGTGWGGDHVYDNLYVNMGSAPAANDGVGTIGVVNLAGEETRYENLQVWANLPVVLTWDRGFMVTNPELNGTSRHFTLKSAVGLPLAERASSTVYAFTGLGRLIALDHVSPCVLMNAAGTVDLGHTFLQRRDANPAAGRVGGYVAAIENWNCYQFRHFGSLEGLPVYMLSRRDLTEAEIHVRVAGAEAKGKPLIQLYDDGGKYMFRNVHMVYYTYDTDRPLIDYKRFNEAGGFTIESSNFQGNLSEINGAEVKP